MNRKMANCLAVLTCLLAGVAAQAGQQQAASSTVTGAKLAKIAEEYWNHELEESIFERQKLGLPIRNLPDISQAHSQAEAAFAAHILAQLQTLPANALTHDQTITVELLKWEAQNTVDGKKFYWLSPMVTPYSSPLSAVNQVYTTYRFAAPEDMAHYLDLVKKYPPFVDAIRQFVEGQYQRGIILPRAEIALVKPFLSSYIREPEKSLFYVATARLKGIDSAAAAQFQSQLKQLIAGEVNASLQRLVAYIGGDYEKKAPEAVGVWQYPDGKEYYRYRVRMQTTQNLTPEQVHQIGLDNVAKLEKQMAAVQRESGFKGTTEEFHHFLKTDPQFFAKTPEEVGQRLMVYVNRVRPRVNEFFLNTPKAPYGVRRLDPALEGGQTFGYYQAPTAAEPTGYYNFNGSDLDHRPMVDTGAIILHELVPGHHFQINLQMENKALPMFRRETYYAAYGEGWGQYSAYLGIEMGGYPGPYDLYGEMALDMFVSTRLVVDTGMNYMGWSRERAMKYMLDHVLETETQVASETLRYSADMPGQALAYKIGELEILRLREKMKQALGSRFDVRQFHDCILGEGPMPLSVLDRHVDWCIEREERSPVKAGGAM